MEKDVYNSGETKVLPASLDRDRACTDVGTVTGTERPRRLGSGSCRRVYKRSKSVYLSLIHNFLGLLIDNDYTRLFIYFLICAIS
jgi:hypothetical protein